MIKVLIAYMVKKILKNLIIANITILIHTCFKITQMMSNIKEKKMLFLKKKTIFIIIFLFFLMVFLLLWKYSFKENKKNLEPLKYERIINAIKMNKPEKLNEVESFIKENNNIYGTLASMFLAKKYILHNNLDKAFFQLNQSLRYMQEENLKNIIILRMTKIKIQKKEYQYAMNMLKNMHAHDWDNIIEDMKGDIFIKKNNRKLAIKSWKKSLSLQNANASSEIINMKINQFK